MKKSIFLLALFVFASFGNVLAQTNPWGIAAVTPGTQDLCQSIVLSDNSLAAGESITVTAKSKNSDIITFGYWLYNMDNLNAKGNPKPIRFVADTAKVAGVVQKKQIATNQSVLTINFSDINRKDRNWSYYMPRPKRIRVSVYFKKAGTTTWSKTDSKCQKTFNAATVDPTPTPVSTCLCSSNNCATSCFYDKFPSGVTYASPVKCNTPGTYKTAPSAAEKKQFCRSYLRVRGDADGNGKVNIRDYFYYVGATVFGAKLPSNVNIDFNGDGVISSADKAILMKSLKPQ